MTDIETDDIAGTGGADADIDPDPGLVEFAAVLANPVIPLFSGSGSGGGTGTADGKYSDIPDDPAAFAVWLKKKMDGHKVCPKCSLSLLHASAIAGSKNKFEYVFANETAAKLKTEGEFSKSLIGLTVGVGLTLLFAVPAVIAAVPPAPSASGRIRKSVRIRKAVPAAVQNVL